MIDVDISPSDPNYDAKYLAALKQLVERQGETIATLTELQERHNAVNRECIRQRDEARAQVERKAACIADLDAEVARLNALINTPRTADFFDAVRNEAAHQIERWGVDHDAGKRSEDWITLFMYLLGKAAKAHFEGDRDKLLHHVITVAAVAMNWHRNVTGENTAMRPGVGQ